MSTNEARNTVLVTVGAVVLAAVGLGLALGVFGVVGVVAIPLALGGLTVLIQPVLGLLGVIAVIPVENTLMVGTATVGKALAVLVALAWFARAILRRESFQGVLASPVVLAFTGFLGFQVLSATWAVVPVRGIGGFTSIGLLLAFAVLTAALVRTWTKVAWVIRGLVVGGMIAATLTVWQFLTGGVHRAGADIAGGINATATILVSLLPFAFYLLRSNGHVGWRLLGVTYLGVATIAIAVTFSRMALLLVPAVIMIESWDIVRSGRGRTWLAILYVGAAVAVIRFVPLEKMIDRVESIAPYVQSTLQGSESRSETLSGRGFHIRVALTIFADYPILGAGFDGYGPLFLQYQHRVPGADGIYHTERSPHGSVWGVLANQGLVGFVLLMAAITQLTRTYLRVRRRTLYLGRSSEPFLMVRAIGLCLGLQLAYAFYAEIDADKLIWVLLGLVVATVPLTERIERARRRRVREQVLDGGKSRGTPPANGAAMPSPRPSGRLLIPR